MFRAMTAQVDVQLLHHRDRFWADAARPHSGAEDLKAVACVVAEQAFRHLATRRVPGAQDEDALFLHTFPVLTLSWAGSSQRKNKTATTVAINCATMNAGESAGRIPAKASLAVRASATAAFATDLEALKLYAPPLTPPTPHAPP